MAAHVAEYPTDSRSDASGRSAAPVSRAGRTSNQARPWRAHAFHVVQVLLALYLGWIENQPTYHTLCWSVVIRLLDGTCWACRARYYRTSSNPSILLPSPWESTLTAVRSVGLSTVA
jgi:hypothetical protein